MPYRRRYRRYRRRARPASTMSKVSSALTTGASVATTAYKAFNLATKLARMVNVEYKFFDVVEQGTAVTQSGTVFDLFYPAQGTQVSQRTGDSVKPIRLSGRFQFTINSSAVTSTVRMIVFRYDEDNGGGPTVGNILASAVSGYQYLAPKDYEQRFDSKILMDRLMSLSINGSNRIIDFPINLKLTGHVQFEPASTETQKGGIYLLVISNEATNRPVMNYHLRTTYVDN